MVTAEWIVKQFEEWAPTHLAEEWDNVGLLIGDETQPVRKALVALDATEGVIQEAISGGYDFIICHHPLVYNPIKRVTTADSVGRKIIALLKNGIGCFCAHTNLDKAIGGVNDCLAEKIGLQDLTPLIPETTFVIPRFPEDEIQNHIDTSKFPVTLIKPHSVCGIGRVGELPNELTLTQLAEHVKTVLNLDVIRYSGDAGKIVKKIGICGGDGSGERYVNAAIGQKCDAYITGDLRYHGVQDALESGIGLLDITHYGGEVLVVDAIVSRLRNAADSAGFSSGKTAFEIFPSSICEQVFK
ncbi:MAG: Nif3-like dinuclear metal center hexameric protein [Defluviitaleaceae bacterium]|nr:Nif3-like dinuclear metal center hexameric protein [Defluviitaleaceae bacterium]